MGRPGNSPTNGERRQTTQLRVWCHLDSIHQVKILSEARHAGDKSPKKLAYQEVKNMRRRRKLRKRTSAKMFAKGVMREHPKNRAMTVRGGIRL